jgi:hypothetical protein
MRFLYTEIRRAAVQILHLHILSTSNRWRGRVLVPLVALLVESESKKAA